MLMSDEPEEVSAETEEAAPEEEAPLLAPQVTETTEVLTEEEEAKPVVKKGKKEQSPEDIAEQERLQKIIAAREVIEVDPIHVPVEYETTGRGKIMIGPPTLTRFEGYLELEHYNFHLARHHSYQSQKKLQHRSILLMQNLKNVLFQLQ